MTRELESNWCIAMRTCRTVSNFVTKRSKGGPAPPRTMDLAKYSLDAESRGAPPVPNRQTIAD
jgi:hypothetical protein